MSDAITITTPVADAMLDAPTVRQLFFDIDAAGELVDIIYKSPGARRAEPVSGPPSLAEAQRVLTAGEVAAVQLRYRFHGEEWWDTLVRTGAGVRLIRISHTQALAMPDS
jgi:hypothetical protein